jgi:alpha-tubulin suppressor-like RCC1 family protein
MALFLSRGVASLIALPCLIAAPAMAVTPSIAVGSSETFAIMADGSLWAWGNLSAGQPISPVPILFGTGYIAVAAGFDHSVVIKADGSLWAWGNNAVGQIGCGSNCTNYSVPQQIGTGYAAVAAGDGHTVAVKSDGTLWAWGYNWAGELGDGTTNSSGVPKQVGTGFVTVAAGYYYNVALKSDGSLWAWGQNLSGQIGDGTRTNSLVPKQIDTGYVAIAAGYGDTVALKSDGSLWAWGDNSYGQLGVTTETCFFKADSWPCSTTPKQIGTGYTKIAQGYSHTVALKADGSLWAWGNNSYGQLGDGTTNSSGVPKQIGTGYVAVAAGGSSTSAVKSDGSLWAWGNNSYGQLGDGTTTNSFVPEQIFNLDIVALTVAKTGIGTIIVPTGINCGSTCTAKYYHKGSAVTLTATPAVNFTSWGGACSGTAPTCTVTMDTAKDVTANFKDAPDVYLNLPSGNPSFATQNLGSTSAPQAVTLNNDGTAALNISSIAASGDFAVTHNCGTGLGVGGYCTLNITFTPTATGARTGTVAITDDAFDSPQTISLTGTGQGAVASPSATAMTFGTQGVGTTSAAQTITLTNTGGAVLNIVSIVVGGDFAQTNNCGVSLAVGANCTISVTFTPTAVGTRTGSLTFGSPNAINISGTGVAIPVVSLNPTSLTFAAQNVGTSSAAQAIALANSGGATLNLTSIAASGDFTQTNNCGGGLGVGGSCSISVTFTPTVAGTRTGSVTITSNAPGSPHTVALTGPITISLDLVQGWNLLGNGVDQILTVASLFSDPLAVTTVWKWDTTNLGWQFYAPSMDSPTLQTYAASKGYGVLSVINSGEGFWVNAKQASTKLFPSGTAVPAISFQDGQPGALRKGWNLIAIGENKTPTQFNALVGAATPLTTLWAWDGVQTNWYFYAPSLEVQGGTVLTYYITSKGYLDFTANSKTLGPGMGFWVNKP